MAANDVQMEEEAPEETSLFNQKLTYDEILVLFSYLTTYEKLMIVPRVCKYWSRIVLNNLSLWKKMDIAAVDHIPTSFVVWQIQKAGPVLKELNLVGNFFWLKFNCNEIMKAAIRCCPNLKILRMTNCYVTDKSTVDKMPDFCSKLTTVQMHETTIRYPKESCDSKCMMELLAAIKYELIGQPYPYPVNSWSLFVPPSMMNTVRVVVPKKKRESAGRRFLKRMLHPCQKKSKDAGYDNDNSSAGASSQ